VAGAIGALASANHLTADLHQAITGEPARPALVQALMAGGLSREEAEKYQFYVETGAIAVNLVTIGGSIAYRFAVKPGTAAAIDDVVSGLDDVVFNPETDTLTVPQIVANRQNGIEFERQVVDALAHVGGTKNTKFVTVPLGDGTEVTTIFDLWGKNVGGFLEAKNVKNLSMSNQLRAQIKKATDDREPVNSPPPKGGGFGLRLKAGSVCLRRTGWLLR